MYTTCGRIEYKPYFAQIIPDKSLGKYLRSLFKLQFGIKLEKPINEHITIISDFDLMENPPQLLKSAEFSLEMNIETNGNAMWIKANCEEALKYRAAIGLEKEPKYALHFCFGYLKGKE